MKKRWLSLAKQYLRRDIYQVADKRNWALHWVAHYTSHYLQERHHQHVHYVTDAWSLRNQIIQFVDRYFYLHGDFKSLHPSNEVFLTWYHGDLTDPNPDMQEIFRLLPQALPYLTKIVTSCTLSRDVLLQIGVPTEQIEIIPIGIDLPKFNPPTPQARQAIRDQFGIPENAICIGSFQKDGQGWEGDGMEPKPVKGPDIFLEVIAGLKHRYPNIMVFLTGPARGYVKKGLDKIGVPYVHHFFENYFDIAPCYHALDLYIITSRSEGGPKALMEGWASGVPIVSTRVGMPADLIQHGDNGFLAEVEDVTTLVELASRVIEDANLRQQFIQRGLEAVKPTDWAVLSDAYFAMYKPYL